MGLDGAKREDGLHRCFDFLNHPENDPERDLVGNVRMIVLISRTHINTSTILGVFFYMRPPKTAYLAEDFSKFCFRALI